MILKNGPHKDSTLAYQVNGMHCDACSLLIQRLLKKVPGIESLELDLRTACLTITPNHSHPLSLAELNLVVSPHGYSIIPWPAVSIVTQPSFTLEDYLAAASLVLIAGAILLRFSVPLFPSVSSDHGFWLPLVFGLFAAFSTCAASTGGLVIAMADRINEIAPHNGLRFLPFFWFALGRCFSYLLVGFIAGMAGATFAPGPRLSGALGLLISVLMILLGLRLLGVRLPLSGTRLPWIQKLSRWTDQTISTSHPLAAASLGGVTVLFPCGLTQAVILIALGSGSALTGGLLMFLFALGTLPGLAGLAAATLFTGKRFRGFVSLSAGFAMVLVGLHGAANAAGWHFAPSAPSRPMASTQLKNHQEITMAVNGLEYSPSRFLVRPGIPLRWTIDSRKAAGCARVLEVSKLNQRFLLNGARTEIRFTPQAGQTYEFQCAMAMTTPGAYIRATGVPSSTVSPIGGQDALPSPPPLEKSSCTPGVKGCPGQVRLANFLYGGHLKPSTLTVKKGVPVRLDVRSAFTPFGCLSGLLIPDFNVAGPLKKGVSRFVFTPTKPGAFSIECGMRMLRYGTLVVQD